MPEITGEISQSLEIPAGEYQEVLNAIPSEGKIIVWSETQALLPKLYCETLGDTVNPSPLYCVHPEGKLGEVSPSKLSMKIICEKPECIVNTILIINNTFFMCYFK